MAKQDGADFLLKKASTTIAGGRTTTFTVNGSAVDVQDQEDDGVQTFLAGKITGQSLEITFEGYEEDKVLRGAALGPKTGRFLDDITLEFPNGDSIACDWFLSAYSETGAYEDGQTFSATLQSDGAWTYTEAA